GLPQRGRSTTRVLPTLPRERRLPRSGRAPATLGGRVRGPAIDLRAAPRGRGRETRARSRPRPRSGDPSGGAPRFSYFGLGSRRSPRRPADPPPILKGGTRMASACGGPGSREGGDNAIPQGPVPPLLRWIQADSSRPFRPPR